jgi:hypothetical protein
MAKTGLGVVLMVAVGALLARDALPGALPADVQRLLAALPLVLVALSYLVYQGLRQPGPRELLKAVLLAAAFIFWAGNQLLPQSRVATLLNDIAVVLFALDVFLVIVGWPRGSHSTHFQRGRKGSHSTPPLEEAQP